MRNQGRADAILVVPAWASTLRGLWRWRFLHGPSGPPDLTSLELKADLRPSSIFEDCVCVQSDIKSYVRCLQTGPGVRILGDRETGIVFGLFGEHLFL